MRYTAPDQNNGVRPELGDREDVNKRIDEIGDLLKIDSECIKQAHDEVFLAITNPEVKWWSESLGEIVFKVLEFSIAASELADEEERSLLDRMEQWVTIFVCMESAPDL